jgi:aminoglycoside 3-N-acetyltransferase
LTGSDHDISTWPARSGVKPGDTIQLMADLTRTAWNARRTGGHFKASELLSAFADAVGPTGDVLIPTFNFDLRDGDTFDAERTRSISGALANAALEHPRYQRTPHALHSFAVTGAHADKLVGSREQGSFGPASPFAFLLERKGILIAIDLPLNDALTFVHFAEERIGVPYRSHKPVRIRCTALDGKTSERTFTVYAKGPGHHMELSALEPLLENAGALTRGEVDGSRFIRVDLPKAYGVIARDITGNKARSIHQFRWSWWLRDHAKGVLRTFGIRTRQERTAHAARTA